MIKKDAQNVQDILAQKCNFIQNFAFDMLLVIYAVFCSSVLCTSATLF